MKSSVLAVPENEDDDDDDDDREKPWGLLARYTRHETPATDMLRCLLLS